MRGKKADMTMPTIARLVIMGIIIILVLVLLINVKPAFGEWLSRI